MASQHDTTCDDCGKGINWENAEYNDETGKVICPSCKRNAEKQKKESKHEHRFENIGKRPR